MANSTTKFNPGTICEISGTYEASRLGTGKIGTKIKMEVGKKFPPTPALAQFWILIRRSAK